MGMGMVVVVVVVMTTTTTTMMMMMMMMMGETYSLTCMWCSGVPDIPDIYKAFI
jgi:hypothetical protein